MFSTKQISIENIVISGGGAAGGVLPGAFKRMEDVEGFSFEDVQRVAGSSVGVVAALAICLGLTTDQMFRKLGTLEFKKFLDTKNKAKILYNLYKHQAISDGQEILNELTTFLKEETDRINEETGNKIDLPSPEKITFRDLRKLGCKELYIVTSECYMHGKQAYTAPKIWSHLTTPDAYVIPAMMASMAVPVLFPIVIIDGIPHIDGGITNNFLLKLFDYPCFMPDYDAEKMKSRTDEDGCANGWEEIEDFIKPNSSQQQQQVKNQYTVGYTLYPSEDVPKKPIQHLGLGNLIQGIINGFLITRLNETIRDNDERVIKIKSPISLTEFDISDEEQHLVILAGAHAVTKHYGLTDEINEEDYKLVKEPALPTKSNSDPLPSLSQHEHFVFWGFPAPKSQEPLDMPRKRLVN